MGLRKLIFSNIFGKGCHQLACIFNKTEKKIKYQNLIKYIVEYGYQTEEVEHCL